MREITKGCPICGAVAGMMDVQGNEGDEAFFMSCPDCGLMTGLYRSLDALTDAWENRND